MLRSCFIFFRRGLFLTLIVSCSWQTYANSAEISSRLRNFISSVFHLSSSNKRAFKPFQLPDAYTSQEIIEVCRQELVSVIQAFKERKKPEKFGKRLLFAEAFSNFLYNWGKLRCLHQELALYKYAILRQETLPFYLKAVATDLEKLQDLLNIHLNKDSKVWSVLAQYSKADLKNILMLILGNPEWCAYFEQDIVQACSYWTPNALRGRRGFADYERWQALGAAMVPLFERLRSTEDYYLRQVNGADIIAALRVEGEEANSDAIVAELLPLTTMPLLQGYDTVLRGSFPPSLIDLGRWGG